MTTEYDKIVSELGSSGFEVTKVDGMGDITVCNPLTGHEFVFSTTQELNAFVLGLQQNG